MFRLGFLHLCSSGHPSLVLGCWSCTLPIADRESKWNARVSILVDLQNKRRFALKKKRRRDKGMQVRSRVDVESDRSRVGSKSSRVGSESSRIEVVSGRVESKSGRIEVESNRSRVGAKSSRIEVESHRSRVGSETIPKPIGSQTLFIAPGTPTPWTDQTQTDSAIYVMYDMYVMRGVYVLHDCMTYMSCMPYMSC